MALVLLPTETREATFPLEVQAGSGQGTKIGGLAVPYDNPTLIRDQHGTYYETFVAGSFRSVGAEGGLPAMLFNHGQDPVFGGLPVGYWSRMAESARGLQAEGQLFGSARNESLREVIGAGQLGLSIRFTVVPNGEIWKGDQRTITEAELREVSVVVFPAYRGTSVALRGSPQERHRRLVAAGIIRASVGDSAMTGRERERVLHAAGILR